MNIIDIRNANTAQWNQPGRDCNTHQYIAMHYLGVSNADNPYLYKVGSDTGFGGHFYISIAGQIYWAAPYNAVLWHVGAGSCYKQIHPYATNFNTIGIEMGTIMDSDGVWRFTEETQQAAVELVKYLMQQLNIPASNVLRHGDITSKKCPQPWLTFEGQKTNWTWNQFKQKISGSSAASVVNNNIGGTVYMFTCKQIQIGANSNEVLLLQEILKARGFYTGALDKMFGNGTKSAVMAYQKARNLTVDGIVGPATWKDLIAL